MVILPLGLMVLMSVSLNGNIKEGLFHWHGLHYRELFQPLYARLLWQSFEFSFVTTLTCVLLGYPVALALATMPKRWKPICLMLLLIPFWSSSLVRIYALLTLLKAKGLINGALLYLGIIKMPLPLLYTKVAVIIGQVYTLLPFMILPIYVLLDEYDSSWIEAAKDLGASSTQLFWRIFWPYSLPAVGSGVMCVFLPAMTLFYIPSLLGDRSSLMLGNVIQEQIMNQDNWPGGAATSLLLTAALLVFTLVYRALFHKKRGGRLG